MTIITRGPKPVTVLRDTGKRTRPRSSFECRELFHCVNAILGPYLFTIGWLVTVMCTVSSRMSGEAKTMITTKFSEEL